jgi:hypothetical protein
MSSDLAALAVAQEAAQCAYDGGDWAHAAGRWEAIARAAPDRYTARHAFYMAACAHARIGELDAAFARLDEALAAEAIPLGELETESALDYPALLRRGPQDGGAPA